MAKTLRELTIKLDTDVAQLKKGLATANKKLSRFQKKTKAIGAGLKNAFSIVAIAAAGRALVNFAGEVSELGKELEGVQAGFKGIDPKILDDMRKSTHGTVTELELMKAAVQAKNFGLPVEKLGVMLEFVHRRARASGESVDFLTKSLVTGLGRKSAMIIDNLGISTSQLNAQLKKTPDFTEAVAEIMKRDMQAAGEYIETAADITERWGAEWENSKAQIGLFINKGIKLIAPVVEKLRGDMKLLFKDAAKWLFDTTNYWIILYNKTVIFRAIVNAIGLTFKTVWITIKTFFKATTAVVKAVGKLFTLIFNPKNWGKGFGAKLKKVVVDGFDAVKMDIKEGGNDWKDALDKSIANMGGRVKMLTPKMFEADEEVIKQAKKTGKDIGKGINEGMTDAQIIAERAKDLVPTIKAKGFSGLLPKVEDVKEEGEKVKKEVGVQWDSINNFVANSFSQLGENLGNAMAGMGNPFSGLLTMLLEFGKQFGKVLIAIGVASVALKKTFTQPLVAIAAGIALIALSTAGIAGLKKANPASGFAQGGIVGGSSFSHDRVPIMAKSGEMVLNNRQQSNMFRQINGGGTSKGGILTARVSGSDLLFILNEAERTNNNSF